MARSADPAVAVTAQMERAAVVAEQIIAELVATGERARKTPYAIFAGYSSSNLTHCV